jgi:hypothetical protein
MDFEQLYFLFYRIFPFVIISFFVIYSIIIGEITGVLVASGALITSIFTIGISGISAIRDKIIEFRAAQSGDYGNQYDTTHCNILTFGDTVISYLPLSTHTISFIIGYLSTAVDPNLYILIPLALFLLIDVSYNYMKCAGVFVIIPLAIGLILGVGWGKLKTPAFTKTGEETCSAATTKVAFNCRRRGIN